MKDEMSRREFLAASLKGAGFTLAVAMTPSGLHILSAAELETAPLSFQPNVFLRIMPDNSVIVIVNKSEMGQGVYTSLPMIIADELETDWKNIRVEPAPAKPEYRDPVWGMQATGGSTSVRHMHDALRTAGAAAREMLIAAGAEAMQVPLRECAAMAGVVRHMRSGKSITYGKLVFEASRLPAPKNPVLKKGSQLKYIGKAVARVDVPEKSTGKANFGIDAFTPNMLYAAVARPPKYGATPASFDKAAAEQVKGVRAIVQLSRGIAVCADTIDAAWKGMAALAVSWQNPAVPGLNTDTIENNFINRMAETGTTAKTKGDVKTALAAADKRIETFFLLPYLAHATMEPINCTASVTKDRCDVWISTQNQGGVQAQAAKITGLNPEQVFVHTAYLGGGFGRRFETDVAEEAVALAKTVGRPVKLIWTREEDFQNDFYRPANYTKIEAGLDKSGQVTAWHHKIVCPSIFARVFPSQLKNGVDPAAVEGVENMEYEIPNLNAEYVRIDLPVPVGFWRSVGSSHNAFTIESFIDILAAAAGKDPVEFRLSLLKNNPRAKRVIETAAEKAGWAKAPSKGQAMGIAYHRSFETHVAQVAEVSVDKTSGKIKVHKVTCAVDCGSVINPNTVIAQMESGIIMGLSAALKEKIEFGEGGVKTANYGDYDILRMSETPEIDVHFAVGGDKLGGIGEPGVPPAAPAVANAVFRAAGIRLRSLPMTAGAVKAAAKI